MKKYHVVNTFFIGLTMISMLMPWAGVSLAHADDLDDPTIIAIFDEVNTVDIWTARLAAQKGHTKAVRDLGRQVASDHEAVQQMARDLAKKLGIMPTPPKNDSTAQDHAETVAMLQRKSGKEFDRAYLQHETKFHAGAIEAVKKTLLPSLENEEFKALIIRVAPGFENHLAMTKALAEKLGYAQ